VHDQAGRCQTKRTKYTGISVLMKSLDILLDGKKADIPPPFMACMLGMACMIRGVAGRLHQPIHKRERG
jgi:hypothetical protein